MPETRRRAVVAAALLPLLIVLQCTAFVSSAAGAGAEACAAVDSLGRLVEFFSRNVDRFDADAYIGMSIASLAIRSEPLTVTVVARECGKSRAMELVDALAQLDHLLRAFRSRFPSPAAKGTYDSLNYWGICQPFDAILRRRLRKGVFHWLRLKESHDCCSSRPHGSLKSANDVWLMLNYKKIVSYNEDVGDGCFREIFKMERRRCSITPTCRSFFLSSRNMFGYGLTHQFIYWLAVIENACQETLSDGTPVDRSLMKDTCRSAFSEHTKILKSSLTRNDVLIDIALEQSVLCGAYGIRNFFTDSTVLLLRRMQSERLGCFSNSGPAANMPEAGKDEAKAALSTAMEDSRATGRKLMHNVVLDGTCSSHTSGLAVAYFAMYLRP